MTLASQIASDLNDVFLQTDGFAETVTYWPKGEAARSILAVRTRRNRNNQEQQHHLAQADEVALLVKRDATTGMTNPQLGDAIRLSTDDANERWDFVSIEDSDLAALIVVFQKKRLLRSGQMRPASL